MPMTQDDARLWDRLRAFDFDGGPATFPFRDRLARDTGWSKARAARVVEEYRRFLLLAAAAGHPVTPSEDVDEAWHLHLTYTRSYWEDLCARVLPAPLHHGPTRGGTREAAKFEDWYARTLGSYQRLFDAEPPNDIWPPAAVRFAPVRRFTRIDLGHAWVVRKPAWWPPRGGLVAMTLLLAGTVTSACTAIDALAPLGVAVLVGVYAVLAAQAFRNRPRDQRWQGDGSSSTGCGTASSHGSQTPAADCSDSSSSDGGDAGGSDGGGGGCGGGCGGGGD